MYPSSSSLALCVQFFILAFALGAVAVAGEAPMPRDVRLVVTDSGHYVLAGKPTALSELRQKLRELRSQGKPIELHVTGGPNTKYEHLAPVMRIVQEEGLGRISFLTEPAASGVGASSPTAR